MSGRPSFDREIDRDLGGLADATVCAAHCDDESLQRWVASHASATTCSYCDRPSSGPIAVDLEGYAEHVFRSLLLEYGGADDEAIPYDGAEGGYQAPTYDTYDLLVEEGAANHEDLLKDLIRAWDGQAWVRRDVWALSEDEALTYGWDRFRRVVLRERRYWFHLASADPHEPSAVPPGRMLPAVGQAIETAELLRSVPVGSRYVRAHTHEPDETLAGAARLGPPPADDAVSNRMSPAGISIFYGAEQAATAIAEVRNAETDPRRSAVTVGVFETTRPLLLVDLCDIPSPPMLFAENAYMGSALRFLQGFARDVSRTVRRDGLEHVDYVPTQVFAEWLRYEFAPGAPIDGVRYRSSLGDGVDVALFVGAGGAADTDADIEGDQPLRLAAAPATE